MPKQKPMQTQVYRLRIELEAIEPMVWRRIEIPVSATFFDLHCAIQDAMGWMDTHLHVFEVGRAKFGIPDDGEVSDVIPSWEARLSEHLDKLRVFAYTYDFGDGWTHVIHNEGLRMGAEPSPRCLSGENACPPEDCGGRDGYMDLVKTLGKPHSEGYPELKEWLKNSHRSKQYWPFAPTAFDEKAVVFRDATDVLHVRRFGLDS